MPNSLPTNAGKTNSDAGTDDPKQSILIDLGTLVDKFNALIASTSLAPLALYNLGLGLGTKVEAAGTPDKLQVSFATLAKSGAYTILAADRAKVVYGDTTATAYSFAFDPAATLGTDWFGYVVNSGTKDLTLDPNAAELINGATTLVLKPKDMALILCDGTSIYALISRYDALYSKAADVLEAGYGALFEDLGNSTTDATPTPNFNNSNFGKYDINGAHAVTIQLPTEITGQTRGTYLLDVTVSSAGSSWAWIAGYTKAADSADFDTTNGVTNRIEITLNGTGAAYYHVRKIA